MNGHGYNHHNGHMSNGYGGSGSSRYANYEQNGERSNAPVVPMANGHGHAQAIPFPMKNGGNRYAHPDMCFYCFDVLYSNLNNVEPPKAPNFTNEAL